jgi:tryptophanyl-tRNA synthetase
MSKSDSDENGRIELVDEPSVIERKIRKAVTDATSLVTYDPIGRPGVSTLVDIEAACTGLDPEEICEKCLLNAYDTGEYKKHVASVLVKHLSDIRVKYKELMADRAHLRDVLDKGAARANELAVRNFATVAKITGFR